MPNNKVKISGEAVWGSLKIKAMKPEFRGEYCWLRPMGGPKGIFRADPELVWCVAYGFNRSNVTKSMVADILADFVRVWLLEIKDGIGQWVPLDSANDTVKKRLLQEQGNRCLLCKTDTPRSRGWHLDHNHETGRIRGVLCGNCNRGLGLLQDNPEILLKAREYLLAEFKEEHGPLWSE